MADPLAPAPIFITHILPLTTSTIISNIYSIIYTCSLLSYFLSLTLNHYHYYCTELSCIFNMLEGKAVIGETDMLQATQDALNLAAKALDIFDVTDATEIARFIKKEFDRTYGPGWQCIVGTDWFIRDSLLWVSSISTLVALQFCSSGDQQALRPKLINLKPWRL